MPEYSSTTITPADGVQLPAQNGATSGNFTLSALRSFILSSKGQANGLAGLGSDGKLDPSQVPNSLDDVLVYATRSNFPAAGTAGKIYIAADTNRPYRWDDALATPAYVELSVDLSAYASKAELAAEESAREAEDTNLKNAITAIDHRVENLEQSKGDYVVQSYKDGSTTPSGKGNWAVVEGLRGVSRVENSLATDGNLEDATKWGTTNGSFSVANNIGTLTLNGATGAVYQVMFICVRLIFKQATRPCRCESPTHTAVLMSLHRRIQTGRNLLPCGLVRQREAIFIRRYTQTMPRQTIQSRLRIL